MKSGNETRRIESVLPHRAAVILATATFPLIWVGGLVTTYDAGMAVPDWPTTYGYNLFLYPISAWFLGPWDLFIEHGHRLLGATVGVLTIALNVVVWWKDDRRWLRWIAFAALLLVILQGLLGGMRVRLNSTSLARIHGCTGPLFFALTVAICVWTSRFWRSRPISTVRFGDCVMTWLVVGLAYFQLVLGAHVRHPNIDWTPSQFRGITMMHLLTALVLLVQVPSVAKRLWQSANRSLRVCSTLLVLLLCTQIFLGIATWTVKYGWPTWLPAPSQSANFTVQANGMLQAVTVTGHVAVGSLFLATSVLLAMRVTRLSAVRRTVTASLLLTQGAVI